MHSNSLVSVIIPTYNRGYIISKSIQSVLNQTYQKFELIIVDDGSTDNTKQVVDAFDDKRIKYIYQKNSGACVARNNGVSVAQGDYIAFHDSDDEWLPEKLELQLSTIEKIGADIVTCKMLMRNSEHGDTIIPLRIGSQFFTLETLPLGIGTQTLLMKKEVAHSIKFDPEMPRLQDAEWLMRAVVNYKVYCVKQYLVYYEVMPDSISSNVGKLYTAACILKNKYPNLMNTASKIAEELSEMMISYGVNMCLNNNPDCEKYLFLGCNLSNKKKNYLKYYLVKFHLFKVCYRIRSALRKNR